MEGGDGAHAFDLVDVAARLGDRLAEQRRGDAIAEQKQPLRLDELDVGTGKVGAGLPVGGRKLRAGT